jgi:hypothetical protein
MMVPSCEGVEKGDAMLHCGIASAGKIVPASRTFRAFDVLVALSGPDKFPSSVGVTLVVPVLLYLPIAAGL